MFGRIIRVGFIMRMSSIPQSMQHSLIKCRRSSLTASENRNMQVCPKFLHSLSKTLKRKRLKKR